VMTLPSHHCQFGVFGKLGFVVGVVSS
jgi:hypothetical protein